MSAIEPKVVPAQLLEEVFGILKTLHAHKNWEFKVVFQRASDDTHKSASTTFRFTPLNNDLYYCAIVAHEQGKEVLNTFLNSGEQLCQQFDCPILQRHILALNEVFSIERQQTENMLFTILAQTLFEQILSSFTQENHKSTTLIDFVHNLTPSKHYRDEFHKNFSEYMFNKLMPLKTHPIFLQTLSA